MVPKEYPLEAAGTRVDEEGNHYIRVKGVRWFTNLDHGKRHHPLDLMTMEDNIMFSRHKEVKGIGYYHYDNYDAIEVPFSDAIPIDYEGTMGVPITFLDKYCPEQFEIIGGTGTFELTRELGVAPISQEFINKYKECGGKRAMNLNTPLLAYYTEEKAIIPYARILIRKK